MKLDPEYDLDAESYSAWLDLRRDLVAGGCSPRYTEGLAETLAQAGRHTGGALLAATRAGLTGYMTAVQAARSHGTAHKRWRDLNRFFSYCAAEEIITASPMARVPEPLRDTKAPAILRAADLDALVKACAGRTLADLRDRAIILLWREPGCPRVSEVAGLRTADVDLRLDEILIHGKGRRDRRLALGPVTAQAFARYARARARHSAAGRPEFFLGLKGPMTRSGLQQMLARRAAAAGIGHVHPHQLRHTVTIAAEQAGIPARSIAALNGWSSTRMLEVYGRAAAAALALEDSRTANLTGHLGARGTR